MPDVDDLRSTALWNILTTHPQWIGWAILAIAFAECFAIVGMLVPGIVLLYVAAFLAGSGELSLWAVLGYAYVGAVLGDGSSFWLGQRFSGLLRSGRPLRNHPEWLDRGAAFFDRHGTASILLGRFVGPIRPLVPLLAGMLGFSALRFYTVSLLGSVVWAPVYVVPGFLLGAALQRSVEPPPALIPGLLLAAALAWAWGRLTGSAWRAGARRGWLYQRLRQYRWCRRNLCMPAFGAHSDTRLSIIAAGSTLLLLGIAASLTLALPAALAPWRRFGADLLQLFWQLL